MIPKIAHFHWAGRPINWMRLASIGTFAKLNPDWEVRLIRTPKHIRACKLPLYAHEADWAWYEALYEYGGFAMATDTVFVRPIPDDWCDATMNGCKNDTGILYHCCVGAEPKLDFMRICAERCAEVATQDNLEYQDMGVDLMRSVANRDCSIPKNFRDVSLNAICPVKFDEVEKCWATDDIQLAADTIGVTWFGGNEHSRDKEWEVPGKHDDAAIVRLARRMLGEVG